MAQSVTPQPQPDSKPAPSRRPPVTGVVPPSLGEALIREVRPTVAGIQPALASLAKGLVRSIVLLPLGWMLQAPLFAMKFGPITARRYRLTNRRLMVRHGLKGTPGQEIALADIDDVRFDPNQVDPYYLSGDLEVVSKGNVVLKLAGVPEPEGFRHTILNAVKAWVPSKATGPFVPASTDVSGQAPAAGS
jgi:hypothetical protein